jgi:hypothetical protein
MAKPTDEVKRLLAELKTARNELDERRIRRKLRKLGWYVSRDGKGEAQPEQADRPQEATVVTTLRLAADAHRRLQLLAADEGKSANAIIEELLRKHLDEQGVPSRLKRER